MDVEENRSISTNRVKSSQKLETLKNRGQQLEGLITTVEIIDSKESILIPTRFLAPIDCLKIPAQHTATDEDKEPDLRIRIRIN
jgi:hypothetical protein